MTITTHPPACIAPEHLISALKSQGYGVLSGQGTKSLINHADLDAIRASWDNLPPDIFLKDCGLYRRRRHACFVATASSLLQMPHRAHYQPLSYNALHGGMHRLFEPVETSTLQQPAWQALLLAMSKLCSEIKGPQPWYIEAHQFRIDTLNGIGRPTPEGAHRDGVDFVAILLVNRENISGGESRIFEAKGPNGQRFTLSERWTLLFLDDQKVIHESTPIQPTATGGHRDTLVLTFRSGGFLEATSTS